jgi:hypothetical protein
MVEKYSKSKAAAEENAKFKIGQFVHFRYRDELYFGYVNWIHSTGEGRIYDIQVGGQCPAIIRGVKEEIIFIVEKK